MTLHCLPTILWGLLLCHIMIPLHRMWLQQRGCRCHIIFLSSFPNNKLPCSIFSHSCCIIYWSRVLCYDCCISFCHFLYCHFHRNMMLCDHTCHTYCMSLWNNFKYCIVSFIRSLIIEPSLLVHVSIVYCFCSTMYSRTNESNYWGPWMISLIYLHFKRIYQVFNIQLKHQRHVTSSHIHLYNILTEPSWTSYLN